jgi:hypothetical protein
LNQHFDDAAAAADTDDDGDDDDVDVDDDVVSAMGCAGGSGVFWFAGRHIHHKVLGLTKTA